MAATTKAKADSVKKSVNIIAETESMKQDEETKAKLPSELVTDIEQSIPLNGEDTNAKIDSEKSGESKEPTANENETNETKDHAIALSYKLDAETKAELAKQLFKDIEQSSPLKVNLKVDVFDPTEIKVKSDIDARTVFVEAKHYETANGFSFCSKELYRKFTVPEKYNLSDMTHNIEDGLLSIEIPIGNIDMDNPSKDQVYSFPPTGKKVEFQADVNVEHYNPDEVSVSKEIDSRLVTIVAKHVEDSKNSVYVARQFTRKFNVPPKYNLEELYHSIDNGILSIHIPKSINDADKIIMDDEKIDEVKTVLEKVNSIETETT